MRLCGLTKGPAVTRCLERARLKGEVAPSPLLGVQFPAENLFGETLRQPPGSRRTGTRMLPKSSALIERFS
jgi:hypothetical protein